MGSFHHHNVHGTHRLVEYEQSLPKTYEGNLKGFCLYHQKDFENRFNQEEQASLHDCHGQNVILVNGNGN